MDKKILITGGDGFIGQHLTNYLTHLGAQLTLCSRHVSFQASHLEVLQLDLTVARDVEIVLSQSKFDVVVHLASLGSRQKKYINAVNDLAMVANLFDALSTTPCQKFILLGSADQYGSSTAPQHETSRALPTNIYSLGKSLTDTLSDYMARTTSLSLITLRPFSVYGPHQPSHMFLTQLLNSCFTREPFHMSHGNQIRDFVYVEDVCRAISCAILNKEGSGIYNIGTGVGTRLWDLVQKVLDLTDTNIEIHRGVYTRPGDPLELVADITRSKRDLGWEPRISLEQGLRKMIESYANIVA